MALPPPPLPGRNVVAVFGKIFLANPPFGRSPGWYVYQRTRLGWGHWPYSASRALQLRRWVKPYDPETLPQLNRRNIFREAVDAWRALPDERKESPFRYRPHLNLPAYQDFLSNYLRGPHE